MTTPTAPVPPAPPMPLASQTAQPAPADPTSPILPPTALGQIEIWKKIVDVQQHFNDLELRVRNFALIVTGAFLGLGGYAIKSGGDITLFGHEITKAGLVVFFAILPLFAFYFMDRLWYHRLLDGSVRAGIDAETALKQLGYSVDLGSQISKASPFRLWVFGRNIHSKTKMDLFYLMLFVTLLAVAFSLGFAVQPQRTTSPAQVSSRLQRCAFGSTSPAAAKGLPSPGLIRVPGLVSPRIEATPGGETRRAPVLPKITDMNK